QQRLIEALNRSDEEVQKTVNDFIQIVIESMKFNSPLLSAIISFGFHCSRLYGWLSKLEFPVFTINKELTQACEAYEYYDHLQGSLSLPGVKHHQLMHA